MCITLSAYYDIVGEIINFIAEITEKLLGITKMVLWLYSSDKLFL